MPRAIPARLLLMLLLACACAFGRGRVSFAWRPLCAGKALLERTGYVVVRGTEEAEFPPELRLALQLVYDSTSARTGMLGHGWRCPQLESTARWERDRRVWLPPWGGETHLRPTKTEKGAPAGSRGDTAPHCQWMAEGRPLEQLRRDGRVAIAGLGDLRGWRLAYEGGRLARGDERLLNEPRPGSGAPVRSTAVGILLNDPLGTTAGRLAPPRGVFRPVRMTPFGETEDHAAFFTGKPRVPHLGYAFLFRNYRPEHAKWTAADPIGYPDGWNNLAYCNNMPITHCDLFGAVDINLFSPVDNPNMYTRANLYNSDTDFLVGGHGSEQGIFVNDNVVPIGSLAYAITHHPRFHTNITVILVSCEVGCGDYAQKLANVLRTDVYAPDCLALYDENGVVSYYHKLPGTFDIPDYSNPGRLIKFRPE